MCSARVVVYTAIAGGFDDLVQHAYCSKDFDYVCYLDNDCADGGMWEIRPMGDIAPDYNRKSKYYKVFPHTLFPEYEYSIWIDGNIDIQNASFEEHIYRLIESNAIIAANPHKDRTCAYHEANTCISLSLDDPEIILRQVGYMRDHGFPENYGLFEMNMIFRKHHDPRIMKSMDDWWRMISTYSRRDQLSFMFVLYENSLALDTLYPENPRLKNDIVFRPHNLVCYSSMQVDAGEGFGHDLLVSRMTVPQSGRFSCHFCLEKYDYISRVRFDPIENRICRLKIIAITATGTTGEERRIDLDKIESNGRFLSPGEYDCITLDPMIIFPVGCSITSLKIEGEIGIYPFETVIGEASARLNEIYNSYTYRLASIIKKIFVFTGITAIARKIAGMKKKEKASKATKERF